MSSEPGRKQIIGTHQTDNVVLPIIRANEIEVRQPPIGSGSFGKVYKGKCRGKDVAVKVLDGIDWDESVLDEFIEEVAIMAQLLHPNILLCMGACTEENFGQNNYAIIMEFMPRGDLHHIVHSETSLPLPRKLNFAIDICQGMAWLSGQGILHRDLKPANVLVDQHWCCKICDFGLSQIQRGKNKLRDEDEAPGSVLWMSPEVLLNEPIDSKLDVYSFALVFWEILTRKELFTEYEDKDVFTEDIARKNVRPPMDDTVPEILKEIIYKSWDRDPGKRPTFQQLITYLEQALVDIYLPQTLCTTAAKFWDKYFRGKPKVAFADFIKNFYKYMEKRNINPIQTTCAEKLLAEEEDGEKFITIERFSALLKWFGPVKIDQKSTVFDRLEQVMKKDWFFGDMSAPAAEDKLQLVKDKPGTFLVRLNMGGGTPIEKTPFTISRIDKKNKVFHTRVYPREEGGFLIQVQKAKDQLKIRNKSNNIEDFITHIKKKEPSVCGAACPGWPYKDLFASAPREKSAYEEVPVDEDE